MDSQEPPKERPSLVDGLRESPSWVPVFTASYEPGTYGGETDEPTGGLPEYGESLVSGDQLEEIVYGPPAPHWLLPHGLLLDEESNGAGTVAGEAASIRGVSFRPEEEITHVFTPTDGLTEMVPASGPVLLLTPERLVAFCHADARRETYLVPVAEVKHVVVKTGSRSATNVAQGVLMGDWGIFIYLALGYWLTGQLGGPTIPVLHMDIASLIALVLVVSGMECWPKSTLPGWTGRSLSREKDSNFLSPFVVLPPSAMPSTWLTRRSTPGGRSSRTRRTAPVWTKDRPNPPPASPKPSWTPMTSNPPLWTEKTGPERAPPERAPRRQRNPWSCVPQPKSSPGSMSNSIGHCSPRWNW